ncbi:hypothetical protein G7062_03845 [Erysipelothrix sp. HDW6C]|uniref:hypothetical protein n=1 Tax=Erysipelothrix sp. HDW6C TaxID=2714930 RepID=UPI001407EDAB|nr:hypothetical protein [Erysipelothrix sp. HDW6C]QIK69477.1 hypothetical protein G7062_03845 [Erysipelothrix sp. HDW6C]
MAYARIAIQKKMLITIFGESCTGKTTYAERIKREKFEIYQGKDYLRLDKSPSEAKIKFQKILQDAVADKCQIIYVITEVGDIESVPEGAHRILMKQDLETIKTRFAKRMNLAELPEPISKMLERKHRSFDAVPHDEVIIL